MDDDFFNLGGHSLTAVRLIGHVRSAFSCRVGVGSVFKARTPRRLLDQIAECTSGAAVVDEEPRADIDAGAAG
jgi:acyl carrier protein